ncbi:MAG: Gfo/Idh/MocA family oxidoreductase [Chthonomonadales bacterium]|nr:Gfo/Idh/MocA family oxidoreductase [Chthonomonadales bacterium]
MGGERLRIGIIGCGDLGAVHARRFADMEGARVVALADPDPGRLARAAEALADPPAVRATDYRDLLDCGLDAVCIASPDAYHVPQVLDALAANLHVLCEKPLTLDPEALEAVVASSAEVGRVVALTYPRHYDGGLRAMRREILSGRWGRVTHVTVHNSEDWVSTNRGTWRHDPAICPGGFFYDASGHQIDTLFWVTGLEPVRVRAESDQAGTPVPMCVWGTARLTGAVPMTFHVVGTARVWREQVNVHCEGMDFALDDGRALWAKAGDMAPIEPSEPSETADAAFVRLVRGAGPNWAPPDAARPIVHFTRAALESAAIPGSPEVACGAQSA